METIEFTFGDSALLTHEVCSKYNISNHAIRCKVLLKALQTFGYDVKHIPVQVLILNPYITERLLECNSTDALNSLIAHKKGKAFNLGLGEEGKFEGYSVLIANNSEGAWLIDPTLSLVNDLDSSLHFLPIGVKVDEKFGEDGSYTTKVFNDCTLIYTSRLDNVISLESPSEETVNLNLDTVANQIFECLSGISSIEAINI
jgi:hypothetical protein